MSPSNHEGPGRLRRAAFLDRDGVLNVDSGYVCKPDDFRWITGAREAIRLLNESGFLTVVVTNQSGIARGYYGESELRSLHGWMNDRLRESGAHLDALYFCPHLPDAIVPYYRRNCSCRKPRPGLLLEAIREHGIDPAASFLIGDKESDCLAAAGAGVSGRLFPGGDLLEFVQEIVAALA